MLRPGHTIADRYVVEALVGSGGLAHVYRVRHIELGSAHALKVLAWDTPALAKRMLREGRIQAQLNHANIVRVTDVLRDGSMVGLLMDYVAGNTLEQHLQQAGPLSLETCLRLMAPVLSAVARAHDVQVLHRDLKPANVLLEQRGSMLVPKVTDFGIAKALSDSSEAGSTRPNAVLGTPGFMAPEQFLDAGQVTPAVDVFSLAVMVQTALTDRPVFPEPTGDVPLVERLLRRPAELPDSLPESLRTALARGMATEPRDRYPDARAFAHALLADHPELLAVIGEAEAGAPLDPVAFTATPAPARRANVPSPTLLPVEAPTRGGGRSRWPLAVAAVLLIGVMATVVWWSRGEPGPIEGVGVPVVGVDPPALPPVVPVPPSPIQDVAQAEPGDEPDGVPVNDEPEPSAVVVPVPTASVDAAPPVARPPEEGSTAATDELAEARTDEDATPEVEFSVEAEAAPDPVESNGDAVAEAAVEVDTEAVASVGPTTRTAPVVSVVAVATEEPEPVVQRAQLAGRWVGTADGRPLILELEQGIDGTVTGQVAFTLGTTSRSFRVIGTVNGERVELDADGAFRFIGAMRNGELGGTYTARSRGRAFPWSTRRD